MLKKLMSWLQNNLNIIIYHQILCYKRYWMKYKYNEKPVGT